MRRVPGTGALLLAAVLALPGCPGRLGGGSSTPESTSRPPVMQIFFMSQCPYSARFLMDLPRIVELVDGFVEIQLVALVGRDQEGGFVAKHGINELLGDTIMLCAAAHSTSAASTAELVSCMSETRTTIPLGWEDCALQAKMKLDPIKACTLLDQGETLLMDSYETMLEQDVPVSPWVVIDGVPHNLSLEPPSVQEALCCAMDPADRQGRCPASPVCYNVPVDVTVITDERCEDCPELLEEALFNLRVPFPMLEVHQMDVSWPGAAELLEAAGVLVVPAVLLHENATGSPAWQAVAHLTYPSGGYLVVHPELMGADFDPFREICDNGVDDTDDGKADCDDPSCADTLPCREEIPSTLDLFVMSQCPFGTQALGAMYEVTKHFGEEMTLKVHWIVSLEPASLIDDEVRETHCVVRGEEALCSLHGAEEARENLRQACVQALYDTAHFMDYARCMTGPAGLGWEECAAAADLDPEAVSGCASGQEGWELLVQDASLSDVLGVNASPTYIWNNRFEEGVLPAPGNVADQMCLFNPEMPGCESTGDLERHADTGESSGKCEE